MNLFLIRNGETHWNQEHRLHGHQDSGLTKTGESQAKILAGLLSDQSLDIGYCSDLGRAIDTAKFIVQQNKGLKIENRHELEERSHGIAEGKTQKEVFAAYPKLQQERFKNKYTYKNPKGESYFDAEQRLKPFAEELRQKHFSHNVLIVSHAGINRILIGIFLGLPPAEIMAIDQPHDCVYWIENADTKPVVKRLTQTGIESGLLKRDETKKPSFENDETDELELEEDWA